MLTNFLGGKCHHSFCWVCLVEYNKDIQHLDDCPHARVNVAVDPGNWVPDNLTDAQINNLIAQAAARLDDPPAAPAPAPQPPAIPPLPPLAAVFGGFMDLIGRGGGGRDADGAPAR